MADLALQVLLKLKDEATAELKKAGDTIGGLNAKAIAIGGAAVAGVAAVGAALWDAAKAAGEEELGVQRLATAVSNSGGNWATAQTAIESYLAAETQRVALDDGAGRDSLTRLTAVTGDYNLAMQALPAVMDLARGANISMETATNLVAKAIDGSTAGLGKYGIELSKEADLTEILGGIQATYGGQAEAYGNTFAGAQDKMGIAMGNLKETIGAVLLPALTDLITKASEIATQALPYVETAFNSIGTVIAAVMPTITSIINTALGIIIPALDALFAFLKDPGERMFNEFAAVISTVMTAITGAISAALTAIAGFWKEHGEEITGAVSGALNTIQSIIQTVMPIIQGVIQGAIALIHGDWTTAWGSIKESLRLAWEAISGVVQTALPILQGVITTAMGAIQKGIETTWTNLKTNAITAWDNFIGVVRDKNNNIWEKVFKEPWQRVEGFFTSIYNNLRNWIGNLWEGIRIKTPHFSIDWEPITVLGVRVGAKPHVSVEWYGKGASFLATQPTLIGVGEQGPEYVNITPQNQKQTATGAGFVSGALYDEAARRVIDAITEMAAQICDNAELNRDWLVYHFRGALSKGISTAMTALMPTKETVMEIYDQVQADLIPKMGGVETEIGRTVAKMSEVSDQLEMDLHPLVRSVETELKELQPKVGNSESSLGLIETSSKGILTQMSDLQPKVGGSESLLNAIEGNSRGIWAQVTDLQGAVGGMETSLMSIESHGTPAPVINFEYSPGISLATQQEVYDKIAPMLRQIIQEESRR